MRRIGVCSWMAVLATALLLAAGPAGAQTTLYVRHPSGGPYGSGNGDSWANAATDPEAVIEGAAASTDIYIAEGDYTIGGQIFLDANNVHILGSVPEGTLDISARDVDDTPTTFTAGVANIQLFRDDINAGTILDALVFTGVAYNNVGGGINLRAGGTNSLVKDCVFVGNTATYGGAVNIEAQYGGELENCRFLRNVASSQDGGAVRIINSQPKFRDCVFIDNTAADTGGAVHAQFSGGFRDMDFTNCVFTGNTSGGGVGGAVSFFVTAGGPHEETFTSCTFAGNLTNGLGGGIGSQTTYSDPYLLEFALTDCYFTSNVAAAASPSADFEGGGALYIDNSVVALANCLITANTSILSAGGLGLATVDATLTSLTVTGNVATGTGGDAAGGGGMNLRRVDGTLEDSFIAGNVSAHNGGGLHLSNEVEGPVAVSNCRISDNTSQAADSADTGGGGVYANTVAASFADCRIYGNEAVSRGGGVYLRDDTGMTFDGCTIHENVARILGGGGALYASDNAVFSDCLVSGNTCLDSDFNDGGGGFYLNNSDCEFRDARFVANLAAETPDPEDDGSGGALSCRDAAPYFASCVFSGNSATANFGGNRGGYVCQTLNSSPVFESCLMSGNTGRYNGAILMSRLGGQPTFVNCTMAHNTARNRGGCFFSQATGGALLANCIIAYNSTNNVGGALDETSGGDFTLDNCLFFGNAPNDFYDEGTTTLNGTDIDNALPAGSAAGTVAADPEFVAGFSGSWTPTVVYDGDTGLSFLDLGGAFQVDALAGMMIEPDTATDFQTYIVSNTAGGVTVVGNVTSWVTLPGPVDYRIYDYRVGGGSPAVDGGTDTVRTTTPSAPPDFDLVGADRPVAGGFGSVAYDIGAYERAPDVATDGSAVKAWMRY